MPFHFDNSYARLPPRFFGRVAPTPVRAPSLVKVNHELARGLGVDAGVLEGPGGVAMLAGNLVPEGAEPIALAYAGHQFGGFVPQLGDGRAILLGEVASEEGRRDVQLKGSGRTPYSRGGDGRAALGPVLREYVVSEAMAALGIPTTRALAAVRTGEPVFRERTLPGAILTRVASSHLRVGTFQFFAAKGDREGLELLLGHAMARHVPSAGGEAGGAERPALALLEHFATVQAELVARWLGVGFVHGVMNTDNSSIAGETLDYGPCAFVDVYAPGRTFSSIDRGGRYAFGNQPKMAQWNLARLAEAILPLVDPDPDLGESLASGVIESFPARFEKAYSAVLRRKLGLTREREGDHAMALDLMGRLARGEVDHTLFFRRLCDAAASPDADAQVASLFADPSPLHAWAEGWRHRLAEEDVAPADRAAAMRRTNPAFIPRNHRIEEMIAAATEGDLAPFERLVAVLARPFDDQPEHAELAEPPGPEQAGYRTFCGT